MFYGLMPEIKMDWIGLDIKTNEHHQIRK